MGPIPIKNAVIIVRELRSDCSRIRHFQLLGGERYSYEVTIGKWRSRCKRDWVRVAQALEPRRVWLRNSQRQHSASVTSVAKSRELTRTLQLPFRTAVMASSGIGAQSRPSMRRKSSATTLLNTFKAGSSNPPPTAPATQLTMQIPSAALNTGFSNYTGASTPVTTTQREWDSQSMKSDSVSSQAALSQNNVNGSPSLAQGTSLESLRDLVMKRMITLTYLRNVHEGYV